MIRLVVVIFLVGNLSCALKEDDNGPYEYCDQSLSDSKSMDDDRNQKLLKNLETYRPYLSISKTIPSGYMWDIKDSKLIFDDKIFQLIYVNHHWQVINENGQMVGTLATFYSEKCQLYSRFELTMHIPQESGSLYFSFLYE